MLEIGQYLAARLQPATGYTLTVLPATDAPAAGIYLTTAGADPALGDEALEPDIIERIGAEAEAEALRRCLSLLDSEQRCCIVLAFVDGFSHSEIAERINAPLGSVKSWIRRGLLSLRRCLEQ